MFLECTDCGEEAKVRFNPRDDYGSAGKSGVLCIKCTHHVAERFPAMKVKVSVVNSMPAVQVSDAPGAVPLIEFLENLAA